MGAPLALNLYTAVSNPITLQGRIALCQGALSHVDCRQALESLTIPMVVVASSKDGFVKPSHVAAMVEARGGEVRSVKRALTERARAVVIWLRCGHELLQEARKPMVNLFEQLATGYHERNDVAFLPLVPDDAVDGGGGGPGGANVTGRALEQVDAAKSRAAAMASQTSALQTMNMASAAAASALDPLKAVPGARAPQQLFEDKFLDNVVSTMRSTAVKASFPVNAVDRSAAAAGQGGPGLRRGGAGGAPSASAQFSDVPDALEDEVDVPAEVLRFGRAGEGVRRRGSSGAGAGAPASRGGLLSAGTAAEEEARLQKKLMLDPQMAAFERRDKEFAESKSRGPPSFANQDVKEYMSWRIRRNKRRLMRVEACAVSIQRAWRSYLARTLVKRMRQQRAALDVQRWWRGCLARGVAQEQKRELWAARVVQRYWRGHKGRDVTFRIKAEQGSASMIQRNWRGYRARKFMSVIKNLRRTAVVKIQAAWRRFLATRETWLKRDLRNAAINVQRVWRGFLGRSRAAKERDRYLFSKSQAQGIEFGRQMLMEHKLHGTRLQSEVSLLTKEKLATEEKIETVLAEIASFEQGVRALEKEMVELSRAEAEAAGTLDEEAKLELRENKIRLDREFAAMLVKIADRRETLSNLEIKLQTIDRARLAKREELKDLERKLVVLLETQQSELVAIRLRQERRSENVVDDAVSAVTKALEERDKGVPGASYTSGGGGGSTMMLADGTMRATGAVGGATGGAGALALQNGGGNGGGGPTPQQRAEAQALMASTETMMKFGFMSMSLTYFSSLNMVRAMRQMGTANTVLASNPMLALIGQMGAAASAGGNPAAVALAASGGATGMMGGMMSQAALTAGPGGGGGGGGGGSQQLALMAATQTAAGATALAGNVGGGDARFAPALKPGQMPGQEAPEMTLWTVGDVSTWLETLALGQYRDAFADAAIDGSFLSELTDDDLRNTLGIEHALHRKKVLLSVLKLRAADDARAAAKQAAKLAGGQAGLLGLTAGAGFGGGSVVVGGGVGASAAQLNGLAARTAAATMAGRVGGFAAANELGLEATEKVAAAAKLAAEAGALKLDELTSWVRHNKGKLLAEALAVLPDGRFDLSLVANPFLRDYGTQYVFRAACTPSSSAPLSSLTHRFARARRYIDMLNGPAFHINKGDDKGNTLLLVAAQNGRQKLAQVLIRKGANPNHQNASGNTAMHYSEAQPPLQPSPPPPPPHAHAQSLLPSDATSALFLFPPTGMAYKFHDLASWLASPDGGGASDAILNADGRGPYDGLDA